MHTSSHAHPPGPAGCGRHPLPRSQRCGRPRLPECAGGSPPMRCGCGQTLPKALTVSGATPAIGPSLPSGRPLVHLKVLSEVLLAAAASGGNILSNGHSQGHSVLTDIQTSLSQAPRPDRVYS